MIVFDFDDTLARTTYKYFSVMDKVLGRLGGNRVVLKEHFLKFKRSRCTTKTTACFKESLFMFWLASRGLEKYSLKEEESIRELIKEIDEPPPLINEITNVLSSLKQKGIKLVLFSRGDEEQKRKIFEQPLDFVLLFDKIKVGEKTKEAWAELLDSSEDNVWVIGDSLKEDILFPMQLGCKGIWIQKRLPRKVPAGVIVEPSVFTAIDRVLRESGES